MRKMVILAAVAGLYTLFGANGGCGGGGGGGTYINPMSTPNQQCNYNSGRVCADVPNGNKSWANECQVPGNYRYIYSCPRLGM